jgi:hypothetical protein
MPPVQEGAELFGSPDRTLALSSAPAPFPWQYGVLGGVCVEVVPQDSILQRELNDDMHIPDRLDAEVRPEGAWARPPARRPGFLRGQLGRPAIGPLATS